jgi:uncharacterized membrane protein
MKPTAYARKLTPWLNAAYWATVTALILAGAWNILGAFDSSSEIVSYFISGLAVVLIMIRFIVLRRRARSRN